MTPQTDVYDDVLVGLGNTYWYRGKRVTHVDNTDLVMLLGESWMRRILNINCDFAYVINGTVKFWMRNRPPIKEFKMYGEKIIESEIENSSFLVFTFVRGDGNLSAYKKKVWEKKLA